MQPGEEGNDLAALLESRLLNQSKSKPGPYSCTRAFSFSVIFSLVLTR